MAIRDEYEGADLNDERLERRLIRLAEELARRPSASFPDASKNDASLEATYRFLANDGVDWTSILAPHVRQTLKRVDAQPAPVVVAHDTTEFNFGSSARKDLGRVGRGKSFGFHGHFAVAVALDERKTPLGAVGFSILKRQGNRGRRGHAALQNAEDNEGRRWSELVEDVEKTLEGRSVIHVMDREADAYALLAQLADQGRRFVVRSASQVRKVIHDEGLSLPEILTKMEIRANRSVPISSRGRSKMPNQRKYFPPRNARIADLSIYSEQVTLRRPCSASQCEARTLTLNIVRVLEKHPPLGEPGVEWRLWTTDPVDTAEQVLAVVDAYRCRWVIEEFFKALKTGCAFEARQLESMHSLLNALAVFVPIAWRLLALRTLAYEVPDEPASALLSESQLICLAAGLREHGRPTLPRAPTVKDALLGIAGLGGHIKNNGPPGWIVLGRGFETLLTLEIGFLAARELPKM